MNNELFRQKSLKTMQSPDNLKDYIKVINPSLWIVFLAAFLLLTGAFVWGTVGKIDDIITVSAVCQDGETICGFNEKIKTGMEVSVNGVKGVVGSETSTGFIIDFGRRIPDGIYEAYVTVGKISPISFVFN